MNKWQTKRWIREVKTWVGAAIRQHGYQITGEFETVHHRDWSIVLRFPTDQGYLFFKAGIEDQAFEARLLPTLSKLADGMLLAPLAIEPSNGWLLLPDGGQRLREFQAGNPRETEWKPLLTKFADLQINLSANSEQLLAAGLPDRRLDRLPTDFAQLFISAHFERVAGAGGLSSEEIDLLGSKQAYFAQAVEELSSLGVPPSIEHGDLHDGNVFYDGQHFQIFDWGDASLSYPFISLIVPLRVLGNSLDLEPESHPDLEWARRAYFDPWHEKFPKLDIHRAWNLALEVGYLQRALTWYKTASSEIDDWAGHAQSFSAWLRDFLYYPEMPPID